MTIELEEIPMSPNLDDEDVWVRGQVYVSYKHLLEEAEERLPGLERSLARARYDYEITRRILDQTADPDAREDWDLKAGAAHDFMAMIEHDLTEAAERAAYYRAMVTEIKADLGDKAQEYESLLDELGWYEDWDEEDWDEFEDWDDEEEWEDEEDDQMTR